MRLGRRAILLAVAASAVQIPSPPPLLRLPALGEPLRFRAPLLHAARLCGQLEGSLVVSRTT